MDAVLGGRVNNEVGGRQRRIDGRPDRCSLRPGTAATLEPNCNEDIHLDIQHRTYTCQVPVQFAYSGYLVKRDYVLYIPLFDVAIDGPEDTNAYRSEHTIPHFMLVPFRSWRVMHPVTVRIQQNIIYKYIE